tara:strand:+ start:910 stop:1110 length:201 start_codon:yes stop_codon:yes gene_type:complete
MTQVTDDEFINGLEAWLFKTVGKRWHFHFESSDPTAKNVGLSISLQVWGLSSDELLDYDGEIRGGA